MTKRGSINHVIHHVRLGDAKREEALEHYRQAGEGLLQLKALCRENGVIFLSGDRKSGAMIRCSQYTRRHRSFLGHLMKLANEWRANGSVDWDRW